MKNINANILLLSYKFTPYNGVGARRWTKFANEFFSKNINLLVVTNNWSKSLNSYEINSAYSNRIIKLTDPIYVLHNIKTLKYLVNKFKNLILKLFKSTDESYIYYLFNYRKIEKLIIANNINCLIATGGPFSTNYFASKIKNKFPSIVLVQEFRDVWIPLYFYANPGIKPSDKLYLKEVEMERKSISNADAVVTVTEGCRDRIMELHNDYKNYYVIKNGFDKNDIGLLNSNSISVNTFDKTKINISHFGVASFGRDEEFVNFIFSIKDYLIANNKYEFHFFGLFEEKNMKRIKEDGFLKNIIKFHGFISHNIIHNYMKETDIHLVINDTVYYYTMGSKFYDAILHKKPVLLISKHSSLSDIILRYKLGWVTQNDVNENIDCIRKLKDYKSIDYTLINWDEFSIQNRANEYLDLIQNLLNNKCRQ